MLNFLGKLPAETFSLDSNKQKIKQKNLYSILKNSTQKDEYVSTRQSLGTRTSQDASEIRKRLKLPGALTTNKIEEWLCSENKSTDGKDDGELSFWSKAANVLEGFGKAAVGTIYNVLSSPKRLAKTVATGVVLSILAANPVTSMLVAGLGIVTAVHLIYTGVKTVYESSKEAKNASNDAQAKDAYEKIGQGLLEVTAGTASGVGAANILRTNVPKLPSAVANAKQGMKNFIKDPKHYLDPKNLPDVKISAEEAERVVIESILDICNIEDDI